MDNAFIKQIAAAVVAALVTHYITKAISAERQK